MIILTITFYKKPKLVIWGENQTKAHTRILVPRKKKQVFGCEIKTKINFLANTAIRMIPMALNNNLVYTVPSNIPRLATSMANI